MAILSWGVAIFSWGVAILKSDFSVSLCQFSKKRPKKKIDKKLDNPTIKWITFLQCCGKVAGFKTMAWVFIKSKVKSWLTKGWRPFVHY